MSYATHPEIDVPFIVMANGQRICVLPALQGQFRAGLDTTTNKGRLRRCCGTPKLHSMADMIPTISEWAGGRVAFARWLNRFYDLVECEAPDIAALFGGRVSREHREHVTDWWTEVMGGPAVYSQQRGGYEHMLSRHQGLAITPAQRLAFVTLLSRATDDTGLPADPEFRAALMGYAEWGTRLAMHNSRPDAEVVEKAPMPRWGWGVAPPYTPG